ncbi:tyrosine-protein phosphatase [Christiangramia aquimixticola]|uniref:tyrosine-protein phosphatase n=1 Tax=Christiangramia aquimixticola TaxID=1697558 RepID=UPI003AA84F83
MFSIFKKKSFLIDHIEGVTDFHNHILPGIDDGAKNVKESLELIREFNRLGIYNLIATPHVIGEYYPNTPESIQNAYNQIQEKEKIKNLGYSAEYMMDQHFIEIIEKNQIIPLVEKKVLVEMSYFQPPLNLNEILFKLQNNTFQPILAHPERYTYLHSKDLEKFRDLKTRGCKFQLNMLSLTPHYGIGIQKMAYKLIEYNLIDYICSDVHKISHLEKIREIKFPKKLETKVSSIKMNNLQLMEKRFN